MAINIHQELYLVQKEILNVIINKQYVHHLKRFLLYLINLVQYRLILINIQYDMDMIEYLNEEFLIKVLLYDILLKNLIKKENQMEEIMYDLMDNKLVQYNMNVLVYHMELMIIIEHIQYMKKIYLIMIYYLLKNNDQYEFEFDLIH